MERESKLTFHVDDFSPELNTRVQDKTIRLTESMLANKKLFRIILSETLNFDEAVAK